MNELRCFLNVIIVALVDSPESVSIEEKEIGESIVFYVKTKQMPDYYHNRKT